MIRYRLSLKPKIYQLELGGCRLCDSFSATWEIKFIGFRGNMVAKLRLRGIYGCPRGTRIHVAFTPNSSGVQVRP